MSKDNTIEAEYVHDEDDNKSQLAVASEVMPLRLHVIPLFERPFFPSQAAPLLIDQDPWMETVSMIRESEHNLAGLVLCDSSGNDLPATTDFRQTGCVVRIHNAQETDDKVQFIAEGIQRFQITKWLSRKPPYLVQVKYLDEYLGEDEDELRAYAMAIINTIRELVPLNPLYTEELKLFLNRFGPNHPALLADFAASLSTASREELQDILETLHVTTRMEKVLLRLKKDLEVAKLETRIRERVDEEMTEQQRRFFLREQLKIIQQELGISKDDRTSDIERFEARLEGLELPEATSDRLHEEFDKLSVLETGSPEYAVTRNYVDWVTALPWGRYGKDQLDLEKAREILDRDHDGLEEVKDRIIEFLAVGSMRGEISGSIILLAGPPGVGKTSIGRSVAAALGRPFYRFSVGGMRDEAEIKGHRRTYIGAMPGKFIQAMKELGVANPLIMLDEIDKVGASYQGDPASALLEVLDPEQNREFHDHYIDLRFDLSKVLFMCTANQLDTIPPPLLDRMEIIRLSGYITAEKVTIAKHHLWPRQLRRAGLKASDIKITEPALRAVTEGYAREAGVRNLEKQLGRIVRKAVVELVGGRKPPISISIRQVEEYLGKPVFRQETPLRGIGVVTGLAWTAMGGVTLDIEASVTHSKARGFKLTGKLGEVMRESAEIAYSYIAANLENLGAAPGFLDRTMVHLHVPEGATPKDGPSAGITMATALLSLARNEKIKQVVAMTGELTLTGQVFPVGGIREKVIAARRSRIRELILPEANRRDFEELPLHIREGISIHFANHYLDVARIIFGIE